VCDTPRMSHRVQHASKSVGAHTSSPLCELMLIEDILKTLQGSFWRGIGRNYPVSNGQAQGED